MGWPTTRPQDAARRSSGSWARYAAEGARLRLADALTDAWDEGEHAATAPAPVLLARVAAAVGTKGAPDPAALCSLKGDFVALAPRRKWRHSVYCHGQIATDRRLLGSATAKLCKFAK